MKRVYVLIVNWNGWQDTIECLESVFRLDFPDYRVIVCDNGSTDGSLERISAWADGHSVANQVEIKTLYPELTLPPVRKPITCIVYNRQTSEEGGDPEQDPQLVLIRSEENLGFAGGNNVGLRYVLARDVLDYVWLLNNDTVIDPQSLKALVARMADKPSAGMCGSTLVHYSNSGRIQVRGGGWYCKWIGLPWHLGQFEKAGRKARTAHVEKWMNYVVGASMLVSRDFLVDAGLLCEDYFLYFEELDWLQRAGMHFTLAYAPESFVYHKVGASIGTRTNPRKKSLACDYYSIRNRIRFTRKYYPVALLTLYPVLSLAIFTRLLFGQWRRGLMILRLILAGGKDLETMKPGN